MNIANRLMPEPWERGPKASAFCCFDGGGDPPQRDVGAETRSELQARIDLAPALIGAEQTYRPQYSQLELENLQQLLFGTPESTRTVQYSEPYDIPGQVIEIPRNAAIPPGAEVVRTTATKKFIRTPDTTGLRLQNREVSVPATAGLLSLLDRAAPGLAQLEAGSLSAQRRSDVADVESLGARATQAFRTANPQQAALLDELNRQAQEELSLGARLDPSLRREVAQSVRAGQAARGVGFGPADVAEEALFTGLTAEQLRRERQGFASGVVGLNQVATVDPFQAILSRPSTTAGAAQGVIGGAQTLQRGLGARLFDPTVRASDVLDFNANSAASSQIASSNRNAAITGAVVGGVGTVLGAAL